MSFESPKFTKEQIAESKLSEEQKVLSKFREEISANVRNLHELDQNISGGFELDDSGLRGSINGHKISIKLLADKKEQGFFEKKKTSGEESEIEIEIDGHQLPTKSKILFVRKFIPGAEAVFQKSGIDTRTSHMSQETVRQTTEFMAAGHIREKVEKAKEEVKEGIRKDKLQTDTEFEKTLQELGLAVETQESSFSKAA